MGLAGTANAYIMRACLSIAITEMVSTTPVTDEDSTYVDPYACPAPTPDTHSSPGRNQTTVSTYITGSNTIV